MLKKLYRDLFYVPKYAKLTDTAFKIRITLYVLTMLVCGIFFCSATFAWFSGQGGSHIASIESAKYAVSVEINDTPLSANEYICPLVKSDEHTFIITAKGTASVGYCVIEIDDKVYSTVAIPQGESITLTIVAAQGTQIRFSAKWGAAPTDSVGERLEISKTPYTEYTVAENITPEQIAAHYGVSIEEILLYNGIDCITGGDAIQIPNTTVTEPPAAFDGEQNGNASTPDDNIPPPSDDSDTPAETEPEEDFTPPDESTDHSSTAETEIPTESETQEVEETEPVSSADTANTEEQPNID